MFWEMEPNQKTFRDVQKMIHIGAHKNYNFPDPRNPRSQVYHASYTKIGH